MTEVKRQAVEAESAVDDPRKSWQRTLGKAGLCIAGSVLVVAPSSAMYTLTQTEVHDDVATIPSTLSFAPDRTIVEGGAMGTVYGNGDFTSYGVGVAIDVKQPPIGLRNIDATNINSLSQPFLDFYQDPEAAVEGNQSALMDEAKGNFINTELAFGSILALSAGGLILLTRELPSRRRKQLIGGLFLAATIASTVQASKLHNDWQAKYAPPEQTFPISGLEGTVVDGFAANNQVTAQALSAIAPFLRGQAERINARRNEFIETAKSSIDQAIESGAFIAPEEDEQTVLLMSDLHSNGTMIEVYRYMVEKLNETYGEGTISMLLSAGDNTYGSAAEKRFIDEMAAITDDEYTINGNHDGPITEANAKDAGMNVLKGETQTTSEPSITVLGDDDPSLTKPSSMLAMGDNVERSSGQPLTFTTQLELEDNLGEQLLETASEDSPTFLLTHEAYSLNDVFDLEDISKQAVYNWFASSSPVEEIPTELVAFGHWHPKEAKVRVITHESGEKDVVVELGSAGGAGKNTLTSFGTPLTVPTQQASIMFVTVKEDGTIRRLQETITETDGEVTYQPPITIHTDEQLGTVGGKVITEPSDSSLPLKK